MFVPASAVLDSKVRWWRRGEELSPWLPVGRVSYLANGRSALRRALRELDVPPGSVAALPSYLCDSVIAPFRDHGCALKFFRVRRSLEADLDSLTDVVQRNAARVLLLIHYFGFPVRGLDDLRAWCSRRGVALIEDCAHALFSRSEGALLGGSGDAAVFSLRKSLPLPEGAFLVLRDSPGIDRRRVLPRWKFRETAGLFREIAYAAEFRLGFSPRSIALGSDRLRRSVYAQDARTPLRPDEPMGRASAFLAGHIAAEKVVEARRRNFNFWLDHLQDLRCAPVYTHLPEGVCPLGYPILVEGRDELRRRLYRAGVPLRTFWDVLPSGIDPGGFPDSFYLSERILVLPVHQSLSERHLVKVLEALHRC